VAGNVSAVSSNFDVTVDLIFRNGFD